MPALLFRKTARMKAAEVIGIRSPIRIFFSFGRPSWPLKGNARETQDREIGRRLPSRKNASENVINIVLMAPVVSLGMSGKKDDSSL
jgi:hypothetical protein